MVLAEAAGPLLTQWENFYIIVGSSAGALTGLQFVVIDGNWYVTHSGLLRLARGGTLEGLASPYPLNPREQRLLYTVALKTQ